MTWTAQSPKRVLDSSSQMLIFRVFRAFRGQYF
jgi:hypothetical protein